MPTQDMKKTETAVSTVRRTDAIRFAPNPLPSLTPANLATYLDSFARGYMRETAILWERITERDDRVGSDANKRYKSIARYGYRIVYADGVDPKSPVARRQADAIKFALENATARDAVDTSVRGGLSLLCRQMQRAVGFKYQVHELLWKPLPGGLTFDAIAFPLAWFERTTGALRFLKSDHDLEGVDLEPNGWLITVGDGIHAATCYLYLLKRMALTDWTLYNGRVGPGIHGETAAAPGSADWTALETAVDNFGFDLKIVTQSGVKISPIEMALKGSLPWPELFEAAQKSITILWRGGNLSSDSGATPKAAGVNLQGQERDMLEQDDAEAISDALNEYVVLPLIRARFNEEPLAWVQWQTGLKPDLEVQTRIDEFLGRQGFPFTAEDLASRYNRPLPGAGDKVLVPLYTAPQTRPIVPGGNAAAEGGPLEPLLAELDKLAATGSPDEIAAWLERLPGRVRELDLDPETETLARAMERAAVAALVEARPKLETAGVAGDPAKGPPK